MSKISDDPRIDPRLKALFGEFPEFSQPSAANREEVLARANAPEALAMRDGMQAFFAPSDTEEIAPSAGLESAPSRSSRSPTATRSTSS